METEIKVVNKKSKEEWKQWTRFEVGDVLETEHIDGARYTILSDNLDEKQLFSMKCFYQLGLDSCDEEEPALMRKVGTLKKVTFEIEE